MKNNGKKYEEFVQKIQQHLIDLEPELKYKNIKIDKNKKIKNRFGCEREFDLYWEWEMAGIIYKTIIECKDYNSFVSIDKLDALIGKMHDFPDIKPIFATRNGYQMGAEKTALEYNIDLLIVRDTNESDWIDSDGTPYIRELSFDIIIENSARITDFTPYLDHEWIKENESLTKELIEKLIIKKENEIFIEDNENQESFSVFDLKQKIQNNGVYNTEQTVKINCNNTYLLIDKKRIKIRGYKYSYIFIEPSREYFSIDFSKQLKGVVENITRKSKKMIFHNQVIER